MTDPTTVRLVPFHVADGSWQMAADETLLHSASEGAASIRLYQWSAPTVSLGYFQPHQVREQDSALVALPFVRRPSGGMTLVHHYEVTYALALPPGWIDQPVVCWLERIHLVIARMLAGIGTAAQLASQDFPANDAESLCFRHITRADVIMGSAKIAGSAQRRYRGALLQHGSILLRTSPFTQSLPGISELTGTTISCEDVCDVFLRELSNDRNWKLATQDWTAKERRHLAELVEKKYSRREWNEKR